MPLSKPVIMVCSAMDEELDFNVLIDIKDMTDQAYFVPVRTGIGTLSVTKKLVTLLNGFDRKGNQVDAILNIGTCSSTPGPSFLAEISPSFVEMESMDLPGRYEKYQRIELNTVKSVVKQRVPITCRTLHRFSEARPPASYIHDMELFTIADLAFCFDIPVYSVKVISDNGDKYEFENNLARAGEKLTQQFPRYLADVLKDVHNTRMRNESVQS